MIEKNPTEHIEEHPKEDSIGFASESDLESMANIWFQNLAQDGRILKAEAKELRLKEYQDKSVDFLVQCFVISPKVSPKVKPL